MYEEAWQESAKKMTADVEELHCVGENLSSPARCCLQRQPPVPFRQQPSLRSSWDTGTERMPCKAARKGAGACALSPGQELPCQARKGAARCPVPRAGLASPQQAVPASGCCAQGLARHFQGFPGSGEASLRQPPLNTAARLVSLPRIHSSSQTFCLLSTTGWDPAGAKP